ncbi:CD5 antigen-like [Ambystoma mexicanum]|uniref:CD5 antigen-like n=1 Tax=Ambystoma mexicanum TaxID=8296 RepID=UPI0037E95A72
MLGHLVLLCNILSVSAVCPYLKTGIRVTHGRGPCAGILLVDITGRWERVCDSQWDMKDAAVACRQLGCGVPYSANFAPIPLQQLPEIVYMTDVQCRGDEQCLAECPYSTKVQNYCYNRRYAGVNCTGPNVIRLVNGHSLCSGRVELRINGVWGTVCDDSWDQKSASVVCRFLSCGFVERYTYNSTFGTSSLPVLMNNVHCMGDEAGLWNCAQGGLEHTICPTGRLAGVTCTGGADELRLVNAGDACSGRVEIKHENQWGAVCSIGWDSKAAQVVCRELGCGTPKGVIIEYRGVFGKGTRQIWLSNVHCKGNETSLSQCPHGSWGYNDCGSVRREAGVICSEKRIFDPFIYKESLTLNPDTAHASLNISTDGKTITYLKKPKSGLNNKERFTDSKCVLGSEGFTSGKHYWEFTLSPKVQVNHVFVPFLYSVGVGKQSALKGGHLNFYRTDSGWWSLTFVNLFGQINTIAHLYKGHTGLIRTLGVFLDYEGQVLSFYDAEHQKHLYTYSDTFTEKVFPYVCLFFSATVRLN